MPDSLFGEEAVARHLPYLSAREDDLILTRQGDLLASAVIGGIDSFTAETSEIEALTNGFARLVGQLGERFGFYVNKVTIPASIELAKFDDDGFAANVDRRWREAIEEKDLKRRVLILTVAIRPSATQKLGLGKAVRSAFEQDLAERKERIGEAMGLLQAMYHSVGFRRLRVSDGDWLGYFGTIQGQEYQPMHAMPGQFLSASMTNTQYLFRRKSFVIDNGMKRRFGAMFGVKAYPSKTMANVLDALELPYDIVITNSFTPVRNNEAEEKIGRVARQMGATEDAAQSLREGLYELRDDVASGRSVLGKHQLTIMVTADSEKELEEAASEVWRAGQDSGATLTRESFACRPMFYSQAPGNWNYRIRASLITSQNFSEFAAFHAASAGRDKTRSPWGENITVLPTVSSCQYRFNFHEPGSRTAEPTSGHTLFVGRPGSGKTLGTAFLVTQARRVGARVVVFDKDLGLEMAVRAMGGTYSSVRIGQPTGFNPFLTETDNRGAAWLTDWVADILSRNNRPLETYQTVALNDAIRRVVSAEPELRSFSALASAVNQTDDDGDLVSRVREWTSGGRFGWLFDEEAEHGIEVGEDVVGIDMSEILDLGTERTALLAYLFRRIERVIEDRRPTILVIDEAWKMLNDEMFVKRLHEWLVTMRKKNCVVMMLTQTPGHLAESSVGSIISEMVSTQILFPNPSAHPEDYRILRLNQQEAEFVSQSTGGMRLALVRSAGDSLFANFDLSGLGRELVTVLGGGAKGEDAAPFDWRHNPNFWKEIA
ncbi:VirB4 family type IV secretion/conjugal transfer ATPase [Roseivivax sediminis]|uniref:VirB4 family type IV secretion/conjugal transfer ATPase n=1 Tax=Roseivivax sediminis TaxID=936889 RepID=UPI00165F8C2B|nr:type IV secretion system protein B4 [Roseivivax sediminis]